MNFEIKKKAVEWLQLPIDYLIKNTHIPPFQRLENQEHVDIIYKGIEEYYLQTHEIFLPGVISVGKYHDKDKMKIYDGQHRVNALKKLSEKYMDVKNLLVRVDVYHVLNDEDGYKIYEIINTSRPVDLYDGNINQFIIPSLQKFMKDTFAPYCKSSKNPRGVNINLEEMAKYFQGYNVIEKLGITLENVQTTLYNRIIALNKFYQKQSLSHFEKWGISDFSDKYKKYLENDQPFYLGLWRRFEWLEHLIDAHGKPFKEVEHTTSDIENIKRQKIPMLTREKVWSKRCGNLMTGECFVCNREVKFSNFHCGHIISVKDGGTNVIENLEPVCVQCNLDMGSMNLNDYKKLFT